MIELPCLRPLYQSMKNQGVVRQVFDYQFRNITFSVAFIVDASPFKLMFGARGYDIFFTADVLPGFRVTPYLGDAYGPLCAALGLQPNPNNPFSPSVLFEHFAQSLDVPQQATTRIPQPHELPIDPRVIAEEGDKRNFVRFSPQPSGKNTSPENLQKTRDLCGEEHYKICKAHNISSCWSANPKDRRPLTTPLPPKKPDWKSKTP